MRASVDIRRDGETLGALATGSLRDRLDELSPVTLARSTARQQNLIVNDGNLDSAAPAQSPWPLLSQRQAGRRRSQGQPPRDETWPRRAR